MFSFKLTIKDPNKLKAQLKQLPERMKAARESLGNSIAEDISLRIKDLIPDKGGWLGIYRSALQFQYDGRKWAVVGEKRVNNIADVEAEKTLLKFGVGDKQSEILSQYNPWPVDFVPAINKSYKLAIRMYSASEAEVEDRRKALKTKMDEVRKKLGYAGFTVDLYGVPKIEGALIADLTFFGHQLETGKGAFPQIRHWMPIATSVGPSIKETVSKSKSLFESIFKGKIPVSKSMTPLVQRMIADSLFKKAKY